MNKKSFYVCEVSYESYILLFYSEYNTVNKIYMYVYNLTATVNLT